MTYKWLGRNSNISAGKVVRQKPIQHEEQMCIRFVSLLDLLKIEESGVKYTHIPLGGKRSIKTAVTMKKMGAKKGVVDYLFIKKGLPRHWIEFKYGNNKTSQEQDEFIEFVRDAGDTASICYSEIDALNDLVYHGFISNGLFDVVNGNVFIKRN